MVAKVLGLSLFESNAVAPKTMESCRRALGDLEVYALEIDCLLRRGAKSFRKAVHRERGLVVHHRILIGRRKQTAGKYPNDTPPDPQDTGVWTSLLDPRKAREAGLQHSVAGFTHGP